MATRKTSTAREPRTLKVRPVAIEARPHELGGLTLHVEATDAAHRKHAIELEMAGREWWPYLARAIALGVV